MARVRGHGSEDTSRNFPKHVSAESPSNISPNPSEVISEVSELYDKPFLDIFDISQFGKIWKIVVYLSCSTGTRNSLGPKILIALMGVLAPPSMHVGTSAHPPIGTSRIFLLQVSTE